MMKEKIFQIRYEKGDYYLNHIIQLAYNMHAHISVKFVGLVSTSESEHRAKEKKKRE